MGVSLPSRRVVRVLNELVALHGRPSAVRVDNGPSHAIHSRCVRVENLPCAAICVVQDAPCLVFGTFLRHFFHSAAPRVALARSRPINSVAMFIRTLFLSWAPYTKRCGSFLTIRSQLFRTWSGLTRLRCSTMRAEEV